MLFILLSMKRMHLRRRKVKKNKIINKIIIIIIFIVIAIIYIFQIFNERALPILESYSEIETKKIVTLIISSTITKEIANNTTMDELFITQKDDNGNIRSIDFNSKVVNDILVIATRKVEENLRYLENGDMGKLDLPESSLSNYSKENLNRGIIYELPSGVIFNNFLLANILPKIPVRISPIGNIICRLETDIKDYGINNALITVNITMSTDVKILLPVTSSITTITLSTPIIMKIIEGNVPSYYMGGYLKTPSLITNVQNE